MKKIFFLLLATNILSAQQIGDADFNPQLKNPYYKTGEGPVIFIDEAHNNFHTLSGRYRPFAEILEKDGYKVRPNSEKFSFESLSKAKILVISNALNERNREEWTLPTPSAFTIEEIDAVAEWIKNGGSLFLIADHMPFPGAAGPLALKFGFKMNNGFAIDTLKQAQPALFTKGDHTLKSNTITSGRNNLESVDSIYSFTGQAFEIPDDAEPVLIFNQNFITLMPDTALVFKDSTPVMSVAGWSQGAVKNFGKGRIVVWGEAAMFSAQTANGKKFGMNSLFAKYNLQLLLNIIHWLDKKI